MLARLGAAALAVWIQNAAAGSALSDESGCMQARCHSEFRQPDVHPPSAEVTCVSCHAVQATGEVPAYHRGSVPGPLAAPGDGRDCVSCHPKAFEPPPSWSAGGAEVHLHGPVAEARCGACHNAHGRSPAELLRGTLPSGPYAPYDRSAYSACFGSCHEAELVEAPRTSEATRFRNGDDNLHFRHVARDRQGRVCGLCHEPHLARNQALVRKGMPFGSERLTLEFVASERGGSCTTSCHMPLAYDRELAIPSIMRVPEPRAWTP